MDYEKAYKAVLQTATQWIKDGCTDKEKICLECVFPELRESEDERIRKKLIEFLDGVWHLGKDANFDKWGKADCANWIAWLEKLKDLYSPADWNDYKDKSIDIWNAYVKGKALGIELGKAVIISHPEAYGLEKQKDKMTAEEFESSELFQLKLKTKYANGYQDGLAQKEQKAPNTRQRLAEWSKTEEGKAKYEEVAKKMREEVQKEQKPEERFEEAREKYQVEWSDNDDQLIGFIFDLLNNLVWRKDWAMSQEECLERLKSLRPSWKPGEDEERLINTSISFLKDFADKGYENAVECIDWLKSKLNGNSGK